MILNTATEAFPMLLGSSKLGLVLVVLLLLPSTTLVLWRLWAFTIKPILHPSEPKELPYWIPWLGHAIEYIKNGQRVITKARLYFHDSREPFALTLGGEKLYFLTAPEDVVMLYRNTESLAFDRIVHELGITFGVSRLAMDAVYRPPVDDSDDAPAQVMAIKNPKRKSLAHLNNDFWKQQLVPGQHYYDLQDKFFTLLTDSLRPERVRSGGAYVRARNTDGSFTVSLQEWTREVLIDAAVRVFFGHKLLDMSPDLITDFVAFDEHNWKLWYKWPNATDMFAAKSRLASAIERWLCLSDEERGECSFIVATMISTQRAIGMSDKDLAKVLCMVVFVTNTNTPRVCFWSLAYLFHSRELPSRVYEEIESAMAKDSTKEKLSFLMDSSPWLAGLFHETLRLCSASSSIRLVTAPTKIGGKILPVGSRVIVPFRQMHFDERVFGGDIEAFHPERFVENKGLVNSTSYRPFGGGISYCPGRFIARQEVCVFIALLLKGYQTELVGDRKFPKLDAGKPTTGLMDAKIGEEVLLKLTPRS
ncbi:2e5bed58-8b25-417b-ab5c-118505115baa [Sclerotinia trifoliorum]|uniref:2e5bed58-8b25-417b-ab5c-118505115baa n=1 Tax=Sclerotinia trifoliorum TaxID=28548 RepID=A0A8H2ZRP8_9HELO|nr:2e5bed58-8b25-417b-ab5c-118505115baa [Sclerotinia trifoliorum]